MTEAAKQLSLDDLDLASASEKGYEFEFINANGKGTGVFITVLGEQSDTVQRFLRKSINDDRQRAYESTKRGKPFAVTSIEDDIDFQIDSAVVRATGWRGLQEEFSPANARRLFTSNKDAREQVIAASRDTGNFTQT